MAKRRPKSEPREPSVEKLTHCSGRSGEGDGTEEASACPFNHSMKSTSPYVCGNCTTGLRPQDIIADKNGITEHGKEVISRDGEAYRRRKEIKTEQDKTKAEQKALGIDPSGSAEDLPSLALAAAAAATPEAAVDDEAAEAPQDAAEAPQDEAPEVEVQPAKKAPPKPRRAKKARRKRALPRSAE